jgi:FAD/FMN-containing dehydrogenase
MTRTRASADLNVSDVRDLRGRVSGRVVLPEDEDWARARQAWNLAADQWPTAVVFPQSAEDVMAIVGLARGLGLAVAPQGTGHFALALGRLENTLLVKTERMQGVEIDPTTRRARVAAGVLW